MIIISRDFRRKVLLPFAASTQSNLSLAAVSRFCDIFLFSFLSPSMDPKSIRLQPPFFQNMGDTDNKLRTRHGYQFGRSLRLQGPHCVWWPYSRQNTLAIKANGRPLHFRRQKKKKKEGTHHKSAPIFHVNQVLFSLQMKKNATCGLSKVFKCCEGV